MRVLLALALLFVIAACGGENGRAGEWETAWADTRGKNVADSVVSTFSGPEHCEWQSVVFLHLGWPLGTAKKMRQYLRDPEGILSEYTIVPLDLNAKLPADAKYSGYHTGKAKLWVSGGEADEAVYIVRADHVERWPRTKRIIACA